MLVYNIKRTINILGFDTLMEKLKNWTPRYPWPLKNTALKTHFKQHSEVHFLAYKLAA